MINLKIIRMILAGIFVIIGAVGLILPVFPTVPFLITAAVIMGKKPTDVIKLFRYIIKNIELRTKRLIRKLKKNHTNK